MASPKILPTDPAKKKAWAAKVHSDSTQKAYFARLQGPEGSNAVIINKSDLEEKGAGDEVTTVLVAKLIGTPIQYGEKAENREAKLSHATHTMRINEHRQFVNIGSSIEHNKVGYNMRAQGREKLTDWLRECKEQMVVMAMSGGRGTGGEISHYPVGHEGYPNPFVAPDADHHYIGTLGDKTKATLASTDKLTLDTVNKLAVRAKTMTGGAEQLKAQRIERTTKGGAACYILMVCPEVMGDIRSDVGDTGWIQAQRALASSTGKDAELFKGGAGMFNGVLIDEAEVTVKFSDYGSGSNMAAARSLFMGANAGLIANGTKKMPDGMGINLIEDTADHGHEHILGYEYHFGADKTRFYNKDYAVISVDTAFTAAF